jgi:glycerol kinase
MQSYIINITDGTTQTTHLAMIKIISIHAIGMDPPTDQYPNPGTVEVLALPNEWR